MKKKIEISGLIQKLKAFRKSRGYSQNQLADYLGIERSSYTRYETGETEPSLFALKNYLFFMVCPLIFCWISI